MQINFSKVVECSEVALFEKTFLIFTIKSMMYSRRFRLSLEETKPYFDCVNCSCRNKMSCVSEMNTRWRASNKFQGFLIVPDLRSCTMLSTLPLFYIAQSVNSDDRRARFQGLRVIMSSLCSVCGFLLTSSPFVVHAEFQVGVFAPEEFPWKIFLCGDLKQLVVLVCHLHGKLFVIHWL